MANIYNHAFFKSRLKCDTGNEKRKMVILVVFFGKSYVTF